MSLSTTFLLFCVGLSLVAAGGLGDRLRRRAPLAWHAHLPWNGLSFLGATAALIAAVHMVNLAR